MGSYVHGDAEDPRYPGTLAHSNVLWVISSIPHPDVNHALLHGLRHHGYGGCVAFTAHSAAVCDPGGVARQPLD